MAGFAAAVSGCNGLGLVVGGCCDPGGMRGESAAADRAIAALLRKQGGLITWPQALAIGWTDAKLRCRARPNGPWRAVLPGIYLTHRTIRMPERGFVLDGICWALAARAVADAARGDLELREVRDLMASAVQGRKCAVRELIDELRAGRTATRSNCGQCYKRSRTGLRRRPRAICALWSSPRGCRNRYSTQSSTWGRSFWASRMRIGGMRKWPGKLIPARGPSRKLTPDRRVEPGDRIDVPAVRRSDGRPAVAAETSTDLPVAGVVVSRR